jgi:hypothetical protein
MVAVSVGAWPQSGRFQLYVQLELLLLIHTGTVAVSALSFCQCSLLIARRALIVSYAAS